MIKRALLLFTILTLIAAPAAEAKDSDLASARGFIKASGTLADRVAQQQGAVRDALTGFQSQMMACPGVLAKATTLAEETQAAIGTEAGYALAAGMVHAIGTPLAPALSDYSAQLGKLHPGPGVVRARIALGQRAAQMLAAAPDLSGLCGALSDWAAAGFADSALPPLMLEAQNYTLKLVGSSNNKGQQTEAAFTAYVRKHKLALAKLKRAQKRLDQLVDTSKFIDPVLESWLDLAPAIK